MYTTDELYVGILELFGEAQSTYTSEWDCRVEERLQLHIERHKENCRRWRALNPKKAHEYKVNWLSKNRERANATARAYSRKYPERRKAATIKYREKNREKLRLRQRAYKVARRKVSG